VKVFLKVLLQFGAYHFLERNIIRIALSLGLSNVFDQGQTVDQIKVDSATVKSLNVHPENA
jgi:hypothetical protein